MSYVIATPLPALGLVKIVVDWTPSQSSDPFHLYRITPDGTRVEVIGSPMVLSGGRAIVYDTTAPLDVALTYQAVIDTPVVAADTFEGRTISSGWGTAELGGPWTTNTAAVDYTVSSGSGRINNATLDVGRSTFLSTSYPNVRMEMDAVIPAPTGGMTEVDGLVRRTDANNNYVFSVFYNIDNTIRVAIRRRVAGTFTELTAVNLPGTYTAATRVRVVGEVFGTSLRMKAWANTPPNTWLTTSDTNFTTGAVGIRSIYFPGSTTTDTITRFDNIRVTSLDPITQSTTTTVTMAAAPNGWIRDPQEPGRSVLLDNCATHTFSCLGLDRFVFFQGLEEESYDSVTGVFSVLESPRPLTVAQPRKDIATALRFVSTTLADITALRSLFSTGRDLVVSLPIDYGWGISTYGTDAVTFRDVTASRLNPKNMRKPQRRWSAQMLVVDADQTYPTGADGSNNIPVPGATYADMEATGLTYLALTQSNLTYPRVADTFATRTVTAGWGTSSGGQVWTINSGTASNFSVSGGLGRIGVSQRAKIPNERRILVAGGEADGLGQADITVPVMPTGGSIGIFLIHRYVDADNYLMFGGFIETTGVVNAAVWQRLAGVDSFIGGLVNTGITHVAGNTYTAKYQLDGASVSSKLWKTGTAEPAFLNTGTTGNLPLPGSVGFTTWLDTANTNTLPVNITVDNLTINNDGRTYLDWSQGVYL